MKHAVLIIQNNKGKIHLGYVETHYSVTLCGNLFDSRESDLLNTLGASDVFGSITCSFCLGVYHAVFEEEQVRYCHGSVNARLNQINERPHFFYEPNEKYALEIQREHTVSSKYFRKSKSRGRQ